MKINKYWIISNILFFLLYFTALYALWEINISSDKLSDKILIDVALMLFASTCATAFIYDINRGRLYYKFVDIPSSTLEITLYSNRIVIVYDNHAWTFTNKRDKIFKADKIKSIHWYNIKKKYLGWELIPYEGKL